MSNEVEDDDSKYTIELHLGLYLKEFRDARKRRGCDCPSPGHGERCARNGADDCFCRCHANSPPGGSGGGEAALIAALAELADCPFCPAREGHDHLSICPYGAYLVGGGGEAVAAISTPAPWCPNCGYVEEIDCSSCGRHCDLKNAPGEWTVEKERAEEQASKLAEIGKFFLDAYEKHTWCGWCGNTACHKAGCPITAYLAPPGGGGGKGPAT